MRDIRRRLKSVKSTAQITKAMQMVAAAKMRHAQQLALQNRPYTIALHNMLTSVVSKLGAALCQNNDLCVSRPIQKEAVILITTDKGLCGSLNANLFKEVMKLPSQTAVIAAGKKGAQFAHRTKKELLAEFSFHDTPKFAEARAITKLATGLFLEKKVDKVSVICPAFKNTMSQHPITVPLLPVSNLESIISDEFCIDSKKLESLDMLFEPSENELFNALLPHYLNNKLYHCLLETKASEFSARMVSMKGATDNANSLTKELTVHYNKLRQTGITNQLLEIASAKASLS